MMFADRGLRVVIYDIDAEAVQTVMSGRLPFKEAGADGWLPGVLESGCLQATTSPTILGDAEAIVVAVGTPVDEYLNPSPRFVLRTIAACTPFFRDGQLLVLRSTLYPGVSAQVESLVGDLGLDIDVSFCPERIAEGQALQELPALPQIISGRTARAQARARELFARLTPELVELESEEAEFGKLMCNAWRYITFAAANQFYMMANDHGLDYERIRTAIAWNYPRAAGLPRAGFAAGPCLFNDTMQLASYDDNAFALGHASAIVNEGLPRYIVNKIDSMYNIEEMNVGILGMSFKANSDDVRSSLSYKLKKILELRAKRVICTDPHIRDDDQLVPVEAVLEHADLLVVAAAHAEYRCLDTDLPVIEVGKAVTAVCTHASAATPEIAVLRKGRA